MKKRVPKRKPRSAADDWNGRHPIGTPVTLRKDNGETVKTITRSAASVLSGHSAVIFVEGVSGCYLLDRVSPLTPTGKGRKKP